MNDAELVTLVGNERRALASVLFAAQSLRLHLQQTGDRWVTAATDLLERADGARRAATLERCVLAGVDVDAPLASIATVSPAPIDGLLAEHRDAMQDLVREIESERTIARALLTDLDRLPRTADGADIEAALAGEAAAEARRRARTVVDDLDLTEVAGFAR